MKRKCGKSNQFIYFRAMYSLSPINIPIPTPASDWGGPVAWLSGPFSDLLCMNVAVSGPLNGFGRLRHQDATFRIAPRPILVQSPPRFPQTSENLDNYILRNFLPIHRSDAWGAWGAWGSLTCQFPFPPKTNISKDFMARNCCVEPAASKLIHRIPT